MLDYWDAVAELRIEKKKEWKPVLSGAEDVMAYTNVLRFSPNPTRTTGTRSSIIFSSTIHLGRWKQEKSWPLTQNR
jgi:hypothetical protein